MKRRLGLALVALVGALGCTDKQPLNKGNQPLDAAAGGAGVGGSTTTGHGGEITVVSGTGGSPQGGSFATGGIGSGGMANTGGTGGTGTGGHVVNTGGSGAGGRSDVPLATGGSAAIDGGVALGGAPSTGGRGGATGGATGQGGAGTGGSSATTTPADDSPGQNPFTRPASSGILITSSDGLNSIPVLLAADSKDGMFVAGATRNPKAMGLTAFDPGIESEAFAGRLDGQGKLLWSVPLKICGVPADIAAGPDDTVFVLCPYEPDDTSLMPARCDASASVEKLSGSDGKVLFEARVNVPASPADGYLCPYGLGVDAQGRSYVGGAYAATSPTERALLTAVTAAGQQDWTVVSDGPAADPQSNSAVAYVTDVDVDTSGGVLFVGGFNTWMKIGTTQLTSQAQIDQSSMYNGFVARVAADGSSPTAWRFGGTVFDLASSVVPTSDGGFVIGGWASASSSIGGKTMSAQQKGSAFLARITAGGQAVWAKAVPSESIADGVAIGPDGKAYLVGQFANDEILYTYDPAGDTLSARKTVTGNATDNGLRTQNVAVSTSGAVWISGSFKGTINLGTGALSTSTVATFLLKLN